MSPPPGKSKSSEGDDATDSDICYSCKLSDCFVTAPKGQKRKISAPSWVHCDSCAEWCHAICQDMADKDVANLCKLKDIPGVKWYCSTCDEEIDIALKVNGDRVPLALLMKKLSAISNIDDYLINWIHDFLYNRSNQ